MEILMGRSISPWTITFPSLSTSPVTTQLSAYIIRIQTVVQL